MMSNVFFDTNIFLYAGDSHDPTKQAKARQILTEASKHGHGFISTQVLQEYYVVEVKKFKRDPLAIKQVLKIWQQFEVVPVTPFLIEEAIDISILNKFSFWDALIVAAALFANCTQLITEDLHHGQMIRGLKIINPFKYAFP